MRPHVFLVLLVIQQVVFAAGNVPNATSNPVKVSVLGPEHVALVINDADANSVQIGEYYRLARNIPAKNIVHVNIPKARTKLTLSEFTRLKWEIDSQLHTEEPVSYTHLDVYKRQYKCYEKDFQPARVQIH